MPPPKAGRARRCARNPADAWAAHALAHVFEMTSRPEDGVAFLTASRDGLARRAFHGRPQRLASRALPDRTRPLSTKCSHGFDRHMLPALKDDATLDRIDAASLLWRLELEGVDVGDRWGAGEQAMGAACARARARLQRPASRLRRRARRSGSARSVARFARRLCARRRGRQRRRDGRRSAAR